MNVGRVKQIVESPKEFTVLYQGVPVWIQNVDENSETARVYMREEPEDEMEVPVTELVEKH